MNEPVQRDPWYVAHPRAAGLAALLVCLLALEGVARLAVGLGLMPYRLYPTNRTPQFWVPDDRVTGMWHRPNYEWHHHEKCLDVVYRSNSAGARDKERSLRSTAPRRFVVLGDSMIEGYGLASQYRVTDVMEARTGIEFMNFATAGGFGTIQEWLLYAERAAAYDHTDVLIFVLPANDFRDNDPTRFASNVYRPFLRRANAGFEVYYPVAFDQRDKADRTVGTVIKNTVDNNVYILNWLRMATALVKSSLRKANPMLSAATYDGYSPADLEVMLYTLDRLAAAAGTRRVHIVTLPAPEDFKWARKRGYQFHLVTELKRFADAHANVDYLDLLPAMLGDAAAHGREFADYQLACDWHWGPLGHAVAADALLPWLLPAGQGAAPENRQ